MQKTAREPEKSGDLAVVPTVETKPVTVLQIHRRVRQDCLPNSRKL